MPPRVPEGSFYTIAEAARALGVSQSTVWRWIKQGKLQAYKFGQKSTRIRRADFEAKLLQRYRTEHGSGEGPFPPPSPRESARRKAVAAKILAHRERLVITPLTTADLVRMARAEEVFYG
jgi:excisionase family DNA binding protein